MALNTNIHEKFKKAFEDKCFILMAEAYHSSINEKIIKLNMDENDISQVLFEKLDSNPKRLEFSIFATREEHLSEDIEKKKGFADKLPRVDLKMSSIISKLELKYFFEAKNLKEKSSALKRRYIATGINNFTTKKYENGSLVGYLLEGDLNKTIQGINSLLIKKDNRSTETLISKKNHLHKDYFESEHIEIGILKHLIFDFTNISN
ncbi:hypothetical protein OAQ99_00745 [Candidatus Kapabacteria bacterium]|nr:hypothetical protein [Candidatus Kapabacteria bacterium]